MNKKKIKITIVGIFIMFLLISIGMIGVSIMKSSISNSATPQMTNATSPLTNTNTVYNIGGIFLLLIIPLIIIMGLVYFSASLEHYNNLTKILDFIGSSMYYFVFGLISILIIIVPGYLIYLLYNYASAPGNIASSIESLKWIVILTLAFFAISSIGYLFKTKIVNKFIDIKKEKEIKENIKELPGVVN